MVTVREPDQVAGDVRRRARRGARYDHRQFLWRFGELRRVRACGRNRIDAAERVQIKVNDGVSHFANLQSCGSVWACPVCAPKIREHRAGEYRQIKAQHREQGGGILFLTLTTRHHAGQDLTAVMDFIANGFRAVISGRQWKADRERFGIVGTIRSMEVTWSKVNGWHPHLHVLVLTDSELDEGELGHLEERVWGRWSRFMARSGSLQPTRARGIHLRRITVEDDRGDDYPFKWDDASELTRSDLKTAKTNGATKGLAPWELLTLAADLGDAEALELWNQYERATKGRQAITFSRGLRQRFLIEELSDEQAAALDVGGEIVIAINELEWRNIKRTRGALAIVLDLAELPNPGPMLKTYLLDLASGDPP